MPFGKCATASKTNAAQAEQNKINITFAHIHSRSTNAFHWKSISMKGTRSFLYRKKWKKNRKWGKNAIFRCTNRIQFCLLNMNMEGCAFFLAWIVSVWLWWGGKGSTTNKDIQRELTAKEAEKLKLEMQIFRCFTLWSSKLLATTKIVFFCVRSWKKVLEIPWICWFAFGKIAHSNLSVWMKCVSRWSLLSASGWSVLWNSTLPKYQDFFFYFNSTITSKKNASEMDFSPFR